MELERRILKSASVLFGANLLSQLANFVFVVYFARSYGPDIFGEYSFALSLGALLTVLVSFGTNGLLMRRCSEDPGRWRVEAGHVFPAQMLLALAAWSGIVVTAYLLGVGETELRVIAVVSSFQLLLPIRTLFAIGFTATERMAYAALADFGGRLAILLLGALAIWFGAAAELTLLILPVSALLGILVLSRLAAAEFGAPSLRFDFAAIARLAREAAPFFGIAALSVAYSRIGLILLRSLGSAEDVGIFAAAERLVMAACILHLALAGAIFPAMVKTFANDKHRFRKLTDRSARLVLLITLPLATVLYAFASDLIDLLYGGTYGAAGDVLQTIAWLIALRGLVTVLNNVGIASDHQRVVFVSEASGIVVLLIASIALVPSNGPHGLAVAMLISQTAKLTLLAARLLSAGYLPAIVRPCLPIFAACAAVLLLNMTLSGAALWLRAALTLVVGSSLLFAFRALRGADVRFLRDILRGPASRQSLQASMNDP